jgi:sulfur relay (sulfurtransferase) complex TusBCD TusD component (DsrE family)
VAPPDAGFGIDMFDRFLHSLESQAIKPRTICLYTEGVKLACGASAAVFGLRMMQAMGVEIFSCKTCLEYYGLLDKVEVGEVRGMSEIVRILLEADLVMTV